MPQTKIQNTYIAAFLISALLLFAPLIASGKSVYALLTLELVSIVLFALVLWTPRSRKRVALIVWLATAFFFLIPCFYLIPVPESLWVALPGRADFAASQQWLEQQTAGTGLAFSLVPQKTLHALIALLPILTVALATATRPARHLITLTYVVLAMAAAQAALGLLQYSTQLESLYFWSDPNRNAQGTYLNRNHFAVMMYLPLPIALGLLALNMGKYPKMRDEAEKPQFDKWLVKTLFIAFVVILLILGGILSRSRTGIFLTIAAIFISSFLFARHIGGARSGSVAASASVIAAGIAFSVGLIPIVNRFISKNPMEDLRWELFEVTREGISKFFPVGSGPGTFQEIYRTIQPYDQRLFINHVHNDYLELLFEIGAVGMVVLFLLLVLYIYGWIALRGMRWHEIRFIKVGAGISLFLIMLHSLVDFNMHTPANALLVAFLAGVFLAKIPEDELQTRRRRKRAKREASTEA